MIERVPLMRKINQNGHSPPSTISIAAALADKNLLGAALGAMLLQVGTVRHVLEQMRLIRRDQQPLDCPSPWDVKRP
jgi:hypothetical protein